MLDQMNEEKKTQQLEEAEFLIELLISGEASDKQFDRLHELVVSEPEVAKMFHRAYEERELLKSEASREALNHESIQELDAKQKQKLDQQQKRNLGL